MSRSTTASPSTEALFDCRDSLAATLVELARADARVVVVVNDSVGSTKLAAFKREFPARLVNVGIAEQAMVSVGAGLANAGLVPFVCAASCFLTGRALEQIKADAAYSNANVKLVGISSGMAYGELGPTHHSVEDIAWTRAIADLAIAVPADPAETAAAIRAAHEHHGPVFVRTSRAPVPAVHPAGYRFEFGRAARLRDGADATIIAAGTMVAVALAGARTLAEDDKINTRVVNLSSISPFDRDEIVAAAVDTGAIVTVEEHSVRGGLGSLVAEVVVAEHPVPMRLLGVPGVFAPTGSSAWLFEHFGLTADGVAAAARSVLARK